MLTKDAGYADGVTTPGSRNMNRLSHLHTEPPAETGQPDIFEVP